MTGALLKETNRKMVAFSIYFDFFCLVRCCFSLLLLYITIKLKKTIISVNLLLFKNGCNVLACAVVACNLVPPQETPCFMSKENKSGDQSAHP